MSTNESTLSQIEVSARLAKEGIQINPSAANAILSADDPSTLLDELVEQHESGDSLAADDVETVQEALGQSDDAPESASESEDEGEDRMETKDESDSETDSTSDSAESDDDSGGDETEVKTEEEVAVERNEHGEPVGDSVYDRWPTVLNKIVRDDRPPCAARNTDYRDIEISKDITGQSTCTGTFDDFASLFRSRYEKLAPMLEDRVGHMSLEALNSPFRGGDDVTAIGMVRRTWMSRNDNRMLEIEDQSGQTMRVVYTDPGPAEKAERLLAGSDGGADEVVGVTGQLSDDAGIIFGDELYYPDVPMNRSRNYADRTVKAAFISDVHLGAEEFAYDEWNNFVNWIRQQGDIEYLLVGGDLVEGIGVYPDQDEELDVVDIYDQYKVCAEAFRELPDDMDIISIVGNHDTGTRLAEPQPTLPDKYTDLFDDNVTFTGNPARVTIEGVDILMYHGMSINTFTDNIMDANLDDPTTAMQLMLEKRHLAPLYGANVRLAPEEDDYLVIEEPPDILHCGHVHKYGDGKYNSVSMFNTSCWQYQTDFQKSKDINPDVGYVTVVDLSTHQYEVEQF